MRNFFNNNFFNTKQALQSLYFTNLLLTHFENKKLYIINTLFFTQNKFLMSKLVTLKYGLLKKNQLNAVTCEARSVAMVFIKTLLTLQFDTTTLSTTYNVDTANTLFYKSYRSKNLLAFKPINYVNFLKNLYLLFYNAGFVGGSFAIIATTALKFDWQSLNYTSLSKLGKKQIIKYVLEEESTKQNQIDFFSSILETPLDFVFVLDSGLNLSKTLGRSATKPFLIGIVDDIGKLNDFDIFMPVNCTSISMQYFFLEFFTAAVGKGFGAYRQTRVQLLKNTQYNILNVL